MLTSQLFVVHTDMRMRWLTKPYKQLLLDRNPVFEGYWYFDFYEVKGKSDADKSHATLHASCVQVSTPRRTIKTASASCCCYKGVLDEGTSKFPLNWEKGKQITKSITTFTVKELRPHSVFESQVFLRPFLIWSHDRR